MTVIETNIFEYREMKYELVTYLVYQSEMSQLYVVPTTAPQQRFLQWSQ